MGTRFNLKSCGVHLTLTALLFAGFGLRWIGIQQRGFWWDEIALWRAALLGHSLSHEGPLQIFLFRVYMCLIRRTDAVAFHILPILIGTAAIGVAFWVGKNLKDKRFGMIYASLLAFLPLGIQLSKEGRPYSLFLISSLLLFYSFITAIERQSVKSWAVFSVCVAVSGMTHLLTIQILFAFGVYFLFRLVHETVILGVRPSWLLFFRFLASATLGGILGIAWVFFRPKPESALEGFYPFGLQKFLMFSFSKLTGANDSGIASNLTLLIILGLAVLGYWALRRESKHRAAISVSLFLISLTVLYVTLGWKGGWAWERYLTHLIPVFVYLVAQGIYFLSSDQPLFIQGLLIAAACSSFFPALSLQFNQRDIKKDLRYTQLANEISTFSNLQGVITPDLTVGYGNDSERDWDFYHNYRVNRLPQFSILNGELYELVPKASVGGLTELPVRGGVAKFETGTFALWSTEFPATCMSIQSSLNKKKYVVAQVAGAKVPICAITKM